MTLFAAVALVTGVGVVPASAATTVCVETIYGDACIDAIRDTDGLILQGELRDRTPDSYRTILWIRGNVQWLEEYTYEYFAQSDGPLPSHINEITQNPVDTVQLEMCRLTIPVPHPIVFEDCHRSDPIHP